MGFEDRQQLAHFGCASVAVENQAPGRAINRARFDCGSERGRNQWLDRLEPCDRFVAERGQSCQTWRVLRCLQQRERLMAAAQG